MYDEIALLVRIRLGGMPHCIPFGQWVVVCIEEENSRGVDC